MTEREIIVREWKGCETCGDEGSVYWAITAHRTRDNDEEGEWRPCLCDDPDAEPCPEEEHPFCIGCGERLYGKALVCDDPEFRIAVGICETQSCALDAIRKLDEREYPDTDGPSSAAVAELVGAYYWRASKREEK